MDPSNSRKLPGRRDERIIIHFDYDCFYAAVFEAENPALKSLPLGVQQKQIIVTCNYEARRRGLYKLQLITEAKRICPEVIIVLGEDISRFRDASKDLYSFLTPFSWSRKVERLGFDEVWFDVTDTVDYTVSLLNRNNLKESFFQLSKEDPTHGFSFDATTFAGHTYPSELEAVSLAERTDMDLSLRLRLGSHLAMHMRHELEHQKGYTSTVGISTNKLLSKLVGNLNKPKGQTTLLPPYTDSPGLTSNALAFLDGHDIGKIPGLGFKTAQKIREHVLKREAAYDFGLVYGGTRESVTVRDVRVHPDISPEKLEELLSGPGSAHGIGGKIWDLLHGIDTSEVAAARPVPRQISIEDSYIRLDTMPEVLKELRMLATSLLNRMRIDLLGDDDEGEEDGNKGDGILRAANDQSIQKGKESERQKKKKWLAHPRTIRLSTRPRQPLQADGTRVRSFKRISHSGPLPQFVFGLNESVDALADKLVKETLVPMFRHLHPQKNGWNLSLVNVAVANMVEAAGSKTSGGRDIGGMFRGQEGRLKGFKVIEDVDEQVLTKEKQDATERTMIKAGPDSSSGQPWSHQEVELSSMQEEQELTDDEAEDAVQQARDGEACSVCGMLLPAFALQAHERFHELGD
ncbi:N-acetyltransferase-like protein 8 [Elsinoe australis]|uniref:N-acetyltransferase-like protein 8 n=1 Tax=Elsinoe australis TaxID=40998 RepID=A0A4U7ANZ7_9PEZI|nr:N-acetyltransferase-like protein 8 [Elsinoe australis]